MEEASQDLSISRIAIAAKGNFFCTGMDLGTSRTPVGQGGHARDAQFERLTKLFEAIDRSPKVTIACINGPVFGGGVGLAFACDIRMCARNATVTLSEGKLGLCPATISKYVIREWGISFARAAMLSARLVLAGELKSMGLVTEVADNQEHLDNILNLLLLRLKAVSPDASRMSKELVRLAWSNPGYEEQALGIRSVFEEMMRPGIIEYK
ncbi:hypothetical protein ETB97_011827 [Aspergillus alliaceus]|uniref:Uncharacterized protein n=1 Tax=Petromyces alliaceus TaxID=209559 RepID=A0A8H6AAH9_PETAA|nr:hypothetical protein ETB97_011827 [Aspergillus burnettii]